MNIKPDQGIRAGLLFTFAVGAAVSLGGCNNPTTPSPEASNKPTQQTIVIALNGPSLSPEASNKPTPQKIRTLRLPGGQPPTAIITPPLGSTLAVVAATQNDSGGYESVTIKQCTVFKRICSELTVTPDSRVITNSDNTFPVSWLLDNTRLK